MDITRKENHLKNMIAFSFMMTVVSGMSSEAIADDGLKHFVWAVSAFFMIIGSSMLSSKLTREGHDVPAAGFIVMSIAQATSYAFIATHDVGNEQFGAVIAIFIPGLLLISLYGAVPLVLRILGILSAMSFTLLALCIYKEVTSDWVIPTLTTGAYMFMNVATLWWAWLIFKRKI